MNKNFKFLHSIIYWASATLFLILLILAIGSLILWICNNINDYQKGFALFFIFLGLVAMLISYKGLLHAIMNNIIPKLISASPPGLKYPELDLDSIFTAILGLSFIISGFIYLHQGDIGIIISGFSLVAYLLKIFLSKNRT